MNSSQTETVGEWHDVPLLPVMTGTLRGRDLQSKMIGFCTQGIRKCVPSPTTSSWTPRNLSKMTALCPASTAMKKPRVFKNKKHLQI